MLPLKDAAEHHLWTDCSLALSSVLSVPPTKDSRSFCKTIVTAFVSGYKWSPKTSFGLAIVKLVEREVTGGSIQLDRLSADNSDVIRAFEMFELADTDLYNSKEDQVISYVSAVSTVINARRLETWKKDGRTRIALAEHKRANEIGTSLWISINNAIPLKFPDLPRNERDLFAVRHIHQRALWAIRVGIL